MEYIINVELNGKHYKTIKSKKDFNWSKLEEVESEIKDKYKGQRHLSSCQGGDHAYYVGLQEKEGVAFCYRYKCIHITDFVDSKGNKICVGDELVSKTELDNPCVENPTIYSIHEDGWGKGGFYLRMYYSRPGAGLCWRDIRNVTQEIIDEHKFIKYERQAN